MKKKREKYTLKIVKDGCIQEYWLLRGKEEIAFLDACSLSDARQIVKLLNKNA